MKYGITVDENGVFRMNGKRFCAYGVNAYTMLNNRQLRPGDDTYLETFKILQKYRIPIIRLPLMYEPIEYYERYHQDPDSFFEGAEHILEEALRCHIGVIIPIINSHQYSSMLGEKPYAIGVVDSKTMAFQKELTVDFVRRYKDNPAVWGWEISNESNLAADMFHTEYGSYHAEVYGPQVGEFNGFDSVALDEMLTYEREIAKSIREVDSYRMISNGAALAREFAHSLYMSSSKRGADHVWNMDYTHDTLKEFREMLTMSVPDPVDTLSLHMAMPQNFQYTLSDTTLDYPTLLQEYSNIAKSAKKGFYYGEFGDMGMDGLGSAGEQVHRNMQLMMDSGIQLATMWQFNGNNDVFSDEGMLAEMLPEFAYFNDYFREAGLQDTDGIWD